MALQAAAAALEQQADQRVDALKNAASKQGKDITQDIQHINKAVGAPAPGKAVNITATFTPRSSSGNADSSASTPPEAQPIRLPASVSVKDDGTITFSAAELSIDVDPRELLAAVLLRRGVDPSRGIGAASDSPVSRPSTEQDGMFPMRQGTERANVTPTDKGGDAIAGPAAVAASMKAVPSSQGSSTRTVMPPAASKTTVAPADRRSTSSATLQQTVQGAHAQDQVTQGPSTDGSKRPHTSRATDAPVGVVDTGLDAKSVVNRFIAAVQPSKNDRQTSATDATPAAGAPATSAIARTPAPAVDAAQTAAPSSSRMPSTAAGSNGHAAVPHAESGKEQRRQQMAHLQSIEREDLNNSDISVSYTTEGDSDDDGLLYTGPPPVPDASLMSSAVAQEAAAAHASRHSRHAAHSRSHSNAAAATSLTSNGPSYKQSTVDHSHYQTSAVGSGAGDAPVKDTEQLRGQLAVKEAARVAAAQRVAEALAQVEAVSSQVSSKHTDSSSDQQASAGAAGNSQQPVVRHVEGLDSSSSRRAVANGSGDGSQPPMSSAGLQSLITLASLAAASVHSSGYDSAARHQQQHHTSSTTESNGAVSATGMANGGRRGAWESMHKSSPAKGAAQAINTLALVVGAAATAAAATGTPAIDSVLQMLQKL